MDVAYFNKPIIKILLLSITVFVLTLYTSHYLGFTEVTFLSLDADTEEIERKDGQTTADRRDKFKTLIKKPLILAATSFFGKNLLETSFLRLSEDCPYKCEYSNNMRLFPFVDAAIFHSRDFEYNKTFSTVYSNPNRLNVLFVMESPANENLYAKHMPADFFNMTISYRRDSSVWHPYDTFELIAADGNYTEDEVWTDQQIEEKLKKKSKPALQFVSNCQTNSKREKISAFLNRSNHLTTYGSCNKNICNRTSCCENDEIDKHYFYFAFENTVCPDYVTEKFWRLKKLIVPVVLKRSVLKGNVEDEYFIAVDDFESPQQLMDRLVYLTQNLDQYRRYLGWTKKYKKTGAKSRALCRICEAATKKKKYSIPDILSWWHKNSGCISNYGYTVFS